jgi:hypothetical protein
MNYSINLRLMATEAGDSSCSPNHTDESSGYFFVYAFPERVAAKISRAEYNNKPFEFYLS